MHHFLETFMDYPLGRLLQAFEIYILCRTCVQHSPRLTSNQWNFILRRICAPSSLR